MNTDTVTEYRNLPLAVLTESATNPRRIFEDSALKELAESIRSQGILSPLLVRPLTDQSFEIIAGARRYRAAQMAEAPTVPVRIVNLTDAEALEAQLIENLQRRDVHPLEEAQGFKTLLNLEDTKYSIEQIAAKVGKSPTYCAARVRLTELAAPVVEAFYAEEIGVGHALLLAKLQPAQQEQALANCFREEWNGAGAKAKRILLPIRHLQQWIEHNVLLLLKQAPFNKRDPQLVPSAGSCVDCPKRAGHNKLLFADVSGNTGGRGRHRAAGQAGVCREGEGEAGQEARRKAHSGQSQEIRVTVTDSLRGLPQGRPPFSCARLPTLGRCSCKISRSAMPAHPTGLNLTKNNSDSV